MYKLYEFFTTILSAKIRTRLGQSIFLKPFRDILLRANGKYKVSQVAVAKNYSEHMVKFRFYADIKTAVKAKNSGIENTIINHSIQLLQQYKSTLNDCVVFDVGSNFGYLSMAWSQSISIKGSVHAFEANKDVFNTFQKTIDYNKANSVYLHNKALGNCNKIIDMYHLGTTSNVVASNNSNTFKIEMMTLDSFMINNNLNRCDLIKIDVDGIEFDIIKGSMKTLNKYKPIYVVETNDDLRIIDFFEDNNYRVLDMRLKEFNKAETPLPLNIFCISR